MFPISFLFSMPIVALGGVLKTKALLEESGEKTTIIQALRHWLEHGEANSILKKQFESISSEIANDLKTYSEAEALSPEIFKRNKI